MNSITEKINKINKITIIMLIIGSMLIIFIPKPKAIGLGSLFGLGGIIVNTAEAVDEIKENHFQVNLLAGIFESPASAMTEVLDGFAGKDTAYTGEMFTDKAEKLIEIIKYIGFMVAVCIALTRLITVIDKGQEPVESVFKCLTEIGIVGIVMINGDKLIDLISQLGFALFDQAKTSFTSEAKVGGAPAYETILKGLFGQATGKVTWQGSVFTTLSGFALISSVVKMICYMAAFQVIIEIGVRRMFYPLAISDIYAEGWRSSGARYLKRFFGCYLKLIVMLATVFIGEELLSDMFAQKIASVFYENTFASMTMMLGVYIAVVMFMLKADQLVNEIVGT